ncbi:hypothetical protein HN51_067026 [Arachis hypogaea]
MHSSKPCFAVETHAMKEVVTNTNGLIQQPGWSAEIFSHDRDEPASPNVVWPRDVPHEEQLREEVVGHESPILVAQDSDNGDNPPRHGSAPIDVILFSETMVRMHQYGLTLRDIQSLIPGRPIDGKVVEMVAVRNACSIQHLKHPLFWCLPPSFADDIMKDVGTQELADCYVPFWIKPSRFISHIFIPIEDIFMHWYCMVVDFGDMTVYHLDSYPDPNMVHDREQLIRKIMGKLHEIMTSETYGHLRRYIPGDLADWPVRRGQGVPNCNTSDSPSSWVISWLNSNGKFNASNISGVLEDSNIRGLTAISLVGGPFNTMASTVRIRARQWQRRSVV